MEKHSNFINQRKRLLYNDGSFITIGDKIEFNGKEGIVLNTDRQSVSAKFNDGTEKDNIQIENIRKIAFNKLKHFSNIQSEFAKIVLKN